MYELHDVFISYRRYEDEERTDDQGRRIAESIYQFLHDEKKMEVFLDEREMETGPFDEQLRWQLEHSPVYIFIGTEAARHFRKVKEPEVDYVAEEVRYALELAEKEKDNRNHDRIILPVIPRKSRTRQEREKNGQPDSREPYPAEIQKILGLQGVELHDELPTKEDLGELLKYVVIKVNRGKLWNAGKHWYDGVRKEGKRFAGLNIEKTIMPLANDRQGQNRMLPVQVHQEQEADRPLMDMIRDMPGHLYLIGEGGIGKTTALFSIMQEVYGPGRDEKDIDRHRMNGQVPIFVELSKAPDTYGKLYEGGCSTFIHRAIYCQIRRDLKVKQVSGASVDELDEVFMMPRDLAVKPIHDLFTDRTPAPEYLLLLDGLNEVSRTRIRRENPVSGETEVDEPVIDMILDEIRLLTSAEYRNVRVILTSRSMEQINSEVRMTPLFLSGLEEDAVRQYLEKRHLPAERIRKARDNEKLNRLLRIPLFLTLYAALEGDEEILSGGEILRLFFHQKRQKLYSAQSRIREVEADIRDAASAKQYKRFTEEMYNFVLDFILPAIAWEMVRTDRFHLFRESLNDREPGLNRLIAGVLNDRGIQAVCGPYGRRVFEKYRSRSHAERSTQHTAEEMISRLGGGDTDCAISEIIDCVTGTLGILTSADGWAYSFIHQHIRDYFAAVCQMNRLRLAVCMLGDHNEEEARACLKGWQAGPLNREVLRFTGEALGEAHNAPKQKPDGTWQYAVPGNPVSPEEKDRALISRILDLYRNRFDDPDDYSVWNLLEILKMVRDDLSGENFSCLNLTGCTANGHPLARPGCAARLNGAGLTERFVIPIRYTGEPRYACFNHDATRIITNTSDEYTVVWDAGTRQALWTTGQAAPGPGNTYISPDGRWIAKDYHEVRVFFRIFDVEKQKEAAILDEEEDCFTSIHFNEDSTRLAVAGGSVISLYYIGALQTDREIRFIRELRFDHDSVHDACFDHAGKQLAVVTDSTLQILNLRDPDAKSRKVNISSDKVKSILFHPDDHRLVILLRDGRAKIWDLRTKKITDLFDAEMPKIGSVCFNQNGTRLLVTSPDNHLVRIFETDPMKETGQIRGRERKPRPSGQDGEHDTFRSARFSPDGTQIITTSTDGSIKTWNAETLEETGSLDQNSFMIDGIEFSPDGKHLLMRSTGSDIVMVIDAQTRRVHGILRGPFINAKYSPDGKVILTESGHGPYTLWNADTLEKLGTAAQKPDWPGPECSPDGQTVAEIEENTVMIRDRKTRQEVKRIVCPSGISQVCFKPDGRELAVVVQGDDSRSGLHHAADGNLFSIPPPGDSIQIWDTQSWNMIREIPEATDGMPLYIRYSPDGKYILGITDLNRITLWDTINYRPMVNTMGHDPSYLTDAAFHPDSRQIAVSSNDGTIHFWNMDEAAPREPFQYYPGMMIDGLDFRKIHPESRLTEKDRKILKAYQAIT